MLWFGASALVGEVYPFSRVSMYASAGAREAGALPIFTADGVEASIQDYHRFSGGPPQDISPAGRCREVGGGDAYPCSVGYIPRRDIEWVTGHLAEEGDDGPVVVTYRYRMLSVAGGRLTLGEDHVVWQGRAWPR